MASASRNRSGAWLSWSIVLALFLAFAASSARADQKIGIVLLHGKLGAPIGVGGPGAQPVGARLVSALKGAGYLVAVPEMCWSRRRGFDKPRELCLAEIDAAIVGLKQAGATAIVVGGQSLGGNGAIAYGATHAGLLGIIGFAPADDARSKVNRPEIAAAVARAQQLMASGKGDVSDSFVDVNTGAGGVYPMELDTTPRIYLSFFDPATGGNIADSMPKLEAPILWIAGDKDPTQRGAQDRFFRLAPANPMNRFVAVQATHLATPDAGTDAVLQWLDELAKR
jgi:pimeloyl-ACP methyl ester carboxylesterase